MTPSTRTLSPSRTHSRLDCPPDHAGRARRAGVSAYRLSRRIWLVLAALAMLAAPPAGAQTPLDPARLMPDNTLAFIGWAGSDAMADPVKSTALGKMLAEPDVKSFASQLRTQIGNAIRQ